MIEKKVIANDYPDKTGDLQAMERTEAGHFKKGVSGNPKGRPYGVKNRVSVVVHEIFEREAPAIIYKLIELAKSGNISAIKLILDRICPISKDADLKFKLPEIDNRDGINKAKAEVQKDFIDGKLSVSETKEAIDFLKIAEKSNVGMEVLN